MVLQSDIQNCSMSVQDKAAPVGFSDIRLRFNLKTDATPEQLDNLLRLTERYCVVYQTLQSKPPVTLTLTRV